MTQIDDPVLQRFARELGVHWAEVAPFTEVAPGEPEADWFGRVQEIRRSDAEVDQAISGVSSDLGELGALHVGWTHFSPGKKAVLNAATAFVVTELDDASREARRSVVAAAVRALLGRG